MKRNVTDVRRANRLCKLIVAATLAAICALALCHGCDFWGTGPAYREAEPFENLTALSNAVREPHGPEQRRRVEGPRVVGAPPAPTAQEAAPTPALSNAVREPHGPEQRRRVEGEHAPNAPSATPGPAKAPVDILVDAGRDAAPFLPWPWSGLVTAAATALAALAEAKRRSARRDATEAHADAEDAEAERDSVQAAHDRDRLSAEVVVAGTEIVRKTIPGAAEALKLALLGDGTEKNPGIAAPWGVPEAELRRFVDGLKPHAKLAIAHATPAEDAAPAPKRCKYVPSQPSATEGAGGPPN